MIGALIVEQMVDSRTPDGFLQRVDVVRTHSATALTNALEYEGLFLMPCGEFLGKGTRYFRGRALPKTLAILGAIAAADWRFCASTRPSSSSKATASCGPPSGKTCGPKSTAT